MRAGTTSFANSRRPSSGAGRLQSAGAMRPTRAAVSLLVLLVVLGICAVVAGAAAAVAAAAPAATSSPALASPSAAGSTLGDPASTITWSLAPARVVYGATVTAQGTVSPAAEGETVTIAIDGVTVASPVTDASGAFTASFVPTAGGSVTATLADASAGTPITLAVAPHVALAIGKTLPWARTRLAFTIAPASYAGLVTVSVYHHGRRVARVSGHAAAGKLVLTAPSNGIGTFPLHVAAAVDGSLAAPAPFARTVKAGWKRLAVGSKGTYARILLKRLVALHFRTPGISSTISVAAGDSIVAFQKACGLPRTYVFDGDDWRKLDTAVLIKARYKGPSTHIEIDKTRQILMIVKGGKPYGIIPVSTGATGNTPVGRFHILRKAPWTSTWLGSAILWRTMDFYRNFAMHGYPSVPAYPASHGCVREPMWVADWTYQHSWVGETVYIYLS
jgi:hypothetical protein